MIGAYLFVFSYGLAFFLRGVACKAKRGLQSFDKNRLETGGRLSGVRARCPLDVNLAENVQLPYKHFKQQFENLHVARGFLNR
jgi:hypothetical protein